MNKNFISTVQHLANDFSLTMSCPEHGKHPHAEVTMEGDNTSVLWSACCDRLKEKIKEEFNPIFKKAFKDETDKQIRELFKR